MFFGTKNFITKPANSLGIFYLATMLEIYLIDVETPSASALTSLNLVLFGWPILIIIGCLILYIKFPLKGDMLIEVKKRVIEKHEKSKS
jgi:Na+/melibiose symporter-like transporter